MCKNRKFRRDLFSSSLVVLLAFSMPLSAFSTTTDEEGSWYPDEYSWYTQESGGTYEYEEDPYSDASGNGDAQYYDDQDGEHLYYSYDEGQYDEAYDSGDEAEGYDSYEYEADPDDREDLEEDFWEGRRPVRKKASKDQSPEENESEELWKEEEADTASVDAPDLLQNPELPTGCESVALTIALSCYDFELEKTTIAEDYLTTGENYAIEFFGDPFSYDGAGIYPPGLVHTANKYLKKQKSDLQAYNLTGTDFDDLLIFIQEGYPVMIWSTMYFEDPMLTDDSITYHGVSYNWYYNEHCVTACGYNLENNELIVSDPLEGIVSRDLDRFREIYEQVGSYAVVILPELG